ncbi:hypothetical protein TeGR_g10848 [Tetraparma gracilis]|uniref:Uncharacterized protein n=1 Tax=Tetraparma gracilis TaxID=2962635 RepID=A0ABQ6MNY2_9STRA|nr:hypothetical protein TeGR_g10848 [Tetraparma gracilis]
MPPSTSDSTPLVSRSSPAPPRRRLLAGALAASALAACAVLFFSSLSPPAPELGAAPAAAAAVPAPPRACSFDECYASSCDWSLAPFACLLWNGGPHGGCGAAPWVAGTCDEQCDLAGCAELPVPDGTPDCERPCPAGWCADKARLCGAAVPYQCIAGAAAYGCSEDKLHWTLEVQETACGECCDVTTC